MVEMFLVLFFATVLSMKYVRWNRQFFFDSESPLYGLWEKNGVAKLIDKLLARPAPPFSSYPDK